MRKWLGWDLNPDSMGPEPKHLIQFPFKLAERTIIRTGKDVVWHVGKSYLVLNPHSPLRSYLTEQVKHLQPQFAHLQNGDDS